MSHRATLLAAVATAALVALAYQRPAPTVLELGTPGDAAITEGFGAAGRSQGRGWRWTTTQSSVRLRAAGQVAPQGAVIRVEAGLPRWARGHARRVTFALDGELLGVVSVASDFGVHEFTVVSERAADGDWVLSLATEGAELDKGTERGVALARVEIVPAAPPSAPALRTLLTTVLGVIALLALLLPRLGARGASAVALFAAALAAAGLAFARLHAVLILPPMAGALTLLLALDWMRRARWVPRLAERLESPSARWIETVAPPLALAGLVLPGLGLWSVPAFGVSLLLVLGWLARETALYTRGSGPEDSPRREALVVAGLTALAFAFRLYRLEGVPFAIFRDEARHGLLALRLLADPSYRPLFVGPPINQPLPYFLGVAAAIRAFGVDLFALRIVSAVAGAIAVPLLYRLVREVLGPREAAVAATLLAVSSWHVSISRFAVNYVEPSLFSLPAYLLLWRALPRARTAALCLAALLIGVAQYSAHTAKPLLIVAVGLVADEVVQRVRSRDLPGLRKLAGGLALAAIVGVVSLGPLILFLRQAPDAYLARAQQVSIWAHATAEEAPVGALLVSNLRTYAGAFHVFGDPNGRHHLPGAPFLDPISGLGLLVGLGLAFTRLSSRANRFLILWLFAGVLPGILTVDAPSALRTVEAAPAVYGVAALGLVALWSRRPWGEARAWPAAVVLLAAITWNAWTYFGRMYDSPTVWRRFAPIATHLGKRLQALRASGSLPPRLTIAMPRAFLDEPDTRYVLQLYWPEGLEMLALEDAPAPFSPDVALAIPNEKDYWALVARDEPRYTRNAVDAVGAQRDWTAAVPSDRHTIVGPNYPATDRPTFWLYLGR